MNPKVFKIVFLSLVILTALVPVSFAQQTDDTAQTVQNEQVMGEEDRLPFMQTEETAVSKESGSSLLLVFRTLGAMVLIVGLIFFGAWGLKKMGFGNLKTASVENAPDLTILSSVSLGSGRTISTVRFGERVLLVGSTAQSFTLLADESDNETEFSGTPRSVAEMLAEENDSFAAELMQAEDNLENWQRQGETI